MKLSEQIKSILTKYNIKGIKLSEDEQKVEMMAKGTTAEGIEVMSPDAEFAVGSEVFITDTDGNPQPAPDGEHIIDGVSKIIVEGGKITVIEPYEVKSSENFADVVEQLAKQNAELSERLTAIESKLATTETSLSSANTKLTESTTKLSEAKAKIAELEKMPAARSVKDVNFKTETKVQTPRDASPAEKIAALMASRN